MNYTMIYSIVMITQMNVASLHYIRSSSLGAPCVLASLVIF